MQPIPAKIFYASVQRELIEALGLKQTSGALTTPDDTEKINLAKALSVVLPLIEDYGKAVYRDDSLANELAQKAGQRLQKSETWQNVELDLRDCKLAIGLAKASIDKELAVCVTRLTLLQPQIDQVLGKAPKNTWNNSLLKRTLD